VLDEEGFELGLANVIITIVIDLIDDFLDVFNREGRGTPPQFLDEEGVELAAGDRAAVVIIDEREELLYHPFHVRRGGLDGDEVSEELVGSDLERVEERERERERVREIVCLRVCVCVVEREREMGEGSNFAHV